jgi:hypothetical protein
MEAAEPLVLGLRVVQGRLELQVLVVTTVSLALRALTQPLRRQGTLVHSALAELLEKR